MRAFHDTVVLSCFWISWINHFCPTSTRTATSCVGIHWAQGTGRHTHIQHMTEYSVCIASMLSQSFLPFVPPPHSIHSPSPQKLTYNRINCSQLPIPLSFFFFFCMLVFFVHYAYLGMPVFQLTA